MSVDRFFDTNVLFYALTSDRRAIAAQSALMVPGLISAQVLNELTLALRRKLGLAWSEVDVHLSNFATVFPDVRPVTAATNRLGREIAQRYSLQFYDSLLIASALEAGCRRFVSEDMQDGMTIDTLVIENPFKPRTA